MKSIGFVRFLLLLVVTGMIASCSDDDENVWKTRNESLFDALGKKEVVLPRYQTIGPNDSVKIAYDTLLYVKVEPDEVFTDTASNGGFIKYKVLRRSNNTQTPYFNSVVKVHYEGRLMNGTLFETTYGKNSSGPLSTIVRGNKAGGVIRGWTEVLQKMHVGDKYEVYIPWNMGYGDSQSGMIPGYSTLIFIMELVEISEL
ncbi:MAG: FKBP-type peptidyl-prolyl cis-trans isomerase [Bacteroidales bacterium]|jgi:peptidylprolyl isomerase|nr:FKBP-type peptidyl-prolyl cis-trans isomerase [Bacteroidales bacterium]